MTLRGGRGQPSRQVNTAGRRPRRPRVSGESRPAAPEAPWARVRRAGPRTPEPRPAAREGRAAPARRPARAPLPPPARAPCSPERRPGLRSPPRQLATSCSGSAVGSRLCLRGLGGRFTPTSTAGRPSAPPSRAGAQRAAAPGAPEHPCGGGRAARGRRGGSGSPRLRRRARGGAGRGTPGLGAGQLEELEGREAGPPGCFPSSRFPEGP